MNKKFETIYYALLKQDYFYPEYYNNDILLINKIFRLPWFYDTGKQMYMPFMERLDEY